MKPTKEQIGKLLVWCGFEYKFVDTWLYPDGSYGSIPDIDSLEFLGFLFKYAVPLLQKQWDLVELIWDVGAWDIHLENYTTKKQFYLGKEVEETFDTLALAICNAIIKLLEENNVSEVS